MKPLPFESCVVSCNCDGPLDALDASEGGGGVDVSSNEDDEVDSILITGSFVLLLLLLLGSGDSICGDI
jgi:hypothetical protein